MGRRYALLLLSLMLSIFRINSNSFWGDPVKELVHPGVDAGEGGVATLDTEGGDPDDGVAAELNWKLGNLYIVDSRGHGEMARAWACDANLPGDDSCDILSFFSSRAR